MAPLPSQRQRGLLCGSGVARSRGRWRSAGARESPCSAGYAKIDIVMKGHLGITTTTAQAHEIIRTYTVKERIRYAQRSHVQQATVRHALYMAPDARYHVDAFSLHLDQIACRACRVHGPANMMANVDPLVVTRSEQQINLKDTLYLKKTSNKEGMLRFTGKQEIRQPFLS